MSDYKDFVKDYPARCIDVLDYFYEKAKNNDREVTLLLMATAGGLVMPYERLNLRKSNEENPNENKIIEQPRLDRSARIEQMDKFKNEINQKIKNSTIFRKVLSGWRYGKPGEIHDEESIKRAAMYAKSISLEKDVSAAIKIIRHSIAHGNVMTLPSPYIGQIQDLIFVSRDGNRKVVSVELVVLTPADLECFLRQWCSFLCSLPAISQQDALDTLEKVAS